jgi:O-antigen ligase
VLALTKRLRLPDDLPRLVRWSAFFYLIHVVFQGKTAVSEIAAGMAPLLLGWALVKRQIRPSFHVLYYPLALYGIASTISSFLAPRAIHSFGENMLWVKMLIFPTAVILFREIPRMRELALYAHALFVTWIASDGLIQFIFQGRRDLEHRITGTATHVMTFSGELMPLAILFAILWIHTRKHWMLIPATLATFALLLTFTRSAWLAWVVAMGVILLFARPRWIAYAAPLAILFITFAPLPIFARFISVFDTKQESNLDRIRMVQAGVEIIRDYPLFGVGPANIKQIYPLYRMHDAPRYRVPHLHNNVVQIWAERGVVALVAYALLLFFFVRECVRAWPGPARRWAQAGIAVAAALTCAGMFEFNFGDTEVFYLMLDVFALVIVSIEAEVVPGVAGPPDHPVTGSSTAPGFVIS